MPRRCAPVKALPIFAGLAGLGLAAWLLHSYGVRDVIALFAHAGWPGLLAIVSFHLVQSAASAAGWRSISVAFARAPGWPVFLLLRLIREGVNNLLPVAQIGGQVVAARLLAAQGMALSGAIATTVADLTLEMITQILFTLLGLGLLVATIGGHGVVDAVLVGSGIAVALAGGFLGAQWFGGGHVLQWAVLRLGDLLGWDGTAQVSGLQEALRACYRQPGAVLRGTVWHALSWLLGGAEVCLILYVLGHSMGLGAGLVAGLVIESLGQALKAAGFIVPGALGVQEGGYIVICGLFDVAPETAIALSLAKRLREVALGLPSLVIWHRLERQAARTGAPAEALS